MKVCASIGVVPLEGDYGDVDGVEAVCSRCGNSTESFGTGGASERRSLVLLRRTCPNAESNLYVSCW